MTEALSSLLKQKPILILAPMAGYTDHAFRLLAREAGADLAYTEMLSAQALHYNSQRTCAMMDWDGDDHPIAAQIFGAEPETMAEAAVAAASRGADVVDINAGCSVPKVLRTNSGAALLRDLGRLRAVLEAVVSASPVPVSLKIRSGWDRSSINAPQVAVMAQEVGVSAVAVHGRTACQGFSGRSDWSVIAEVKRLVTIPVYGSGDVADHEDALRMLEETSCDGIMIGRAAIGNPWVLTRVKAFLRGQPVPSEPSAEERILLLLRHARMIVQFKGEHIGMHQLRGHAGRYLRGIPRASEMRAAVMQADTLEQLECLLYDALKGLRERLAVA
ncbi:MAG: tRNA dihydrouridine synthase DusB [Armatimonadota bacterium]